VQGCRAHCVFVLRGRGGGVFLQAWRLRALAMAAIAFLSCACAFFSHLSSQSRLLFRDQVKFLWILEDCVQHYIML